jgi:hypothetical protein
MKHRTPHRFRTRRCLPLLAAGALALSGLLGVPSGNGQPVAAAPGAALQISVTGGPTPASTQALAIETAVRTEIPNALDAGITLLSSTPPLSDLPAASTATVQATVQIARAAQPPTTITLPVTFTNVILPWSDAQSLLVSNSPETLPFGKVLFSGSLEASQTVRLLYHHQNGSTTQHMFITVTLSNPTEAPVTVWITGAQSGPSGNELVMGHEAARTFLEAYWRHAGFLMQIPANTTLPLLVHDLAPQTVGSGLAQIQMVDGQRLTVQVVARLAGEMDPPMDSYAPDFDKAHQRGAFQRPQIVRSLRYTVGGQVATMMLGDNADLLQEEDTGEALQGNYGVIYDFDAEITNPTPDPATVALTMHADGGQASGTFFVGDQVFDVPVVQPNAPKVVTAFRMGPGTRRTLHIATMPESGSNYPVRLTLGPP